MDLKRANTMILGANVPKVMNTKPVNNSIFSMKCLTPKITPNDNQIMSTPLIAIHKLIRDTTVSLHFETMLKEIFNKYDADNSGAIDHKELKIFVDELRVSLNLLPCDKDIITRISKIVDENGDGEIDIEEFLMHLHRVLPILSEPGQEMCTLQKKVFKDFDIDENGYLKKNEMNLLLNLSCDKIGVQRCTKWETDYILSLINDSEKQEIHQNDFVKNYWVILNEIQKNKKLTKKQKALTGGDFFRDEQHKIAIFEDEDKYRFMKLLGEECRRCEKLKTKSAQFEKITKEIEFNPSNANAVNLDMVSSFSKDHSKVLVSLQNMINVAAPGHIKEEKGFELVSINEMVKSKRELDICSKNNKSFLAINESPREKETIENKYEEISDYLSSKLKKTLNIKPDEEQIEITSHRKTSLNDIRENSFISKDDFVTHNYYTKGKNLSNSNKQNYKTNTQHFYNKPDGGSRLSIRLNTSEKSKILESKVINKNAFIIDSIINKGAKPKSPDNLSKSLNNRSKSNLKKEDKLMLALNTVENYIKVLRKGTNINENCESPPNESIFDLKKNSNFNIMKFFGNYNIDEIENLIKCSKDLKIYLDEKLSNQQVYMFDILRFINQKSLMVSQKNVAERKQLGYIKEVFDEYSDLFSTTKNLFEVFKESPAEIERNQTQPDKFNQINFFDYIDKMKNKTPQYDTMTPGVNSTRNKKELQRSFEINQFGNSLHKNKTEKETDANLKRAKSDKKNVVGKQFSKYKIPQEKVQPLLDLKSKISKVGHFHTHQPVKLSTESLNKAKENLQKQKFENLIKIPTAYNPNSVYKKNNQNPSVDMQKTFFMVAKQDKYNT